jgi:hypothetical protein
MAGVPPLPPFRMTKQSAAAFPGERRPSEVVRRTRSKHKRRSTRLLWRETVPSCYGHSVNDAFNYVAVLVSIITGPAATRACPARSRRQASLAAKSKGNGLLTITSYRRNGRRQRVPRRARTSNALCVDVMETEEPAQLFPHLRSDRAARHRGHIAQRQTTLVGSRARFTCRSSPCGRFGCLAAAISTIPRYHAIWAITFPAMITSYITAVLIQLG